MDNESILDTITAYTSTYPDEDITALHEFVASNMELISRKNPAGHVTGSVILLNGSGEVLLIENPKFPGKVIFPGGHIDTRDMSVEQGAIRELREELGIGHLPFSHVTKPGMPLDIDIHWIAANPKKQEGEHQHYDFRFAFICDPFPKFAPDESEIQNMLFLTVSQLQEMPMHARIADKLQRILTDTIRS